MSSEAGYDPLDRRGERQPLRDSPIESDKVDLHAVVDDVARERTEAEAVAELVDATVGAGRSDESVAVRVEEAVNREATEHLHHAQPAGASPGWRHGQVAQDADVRAKLPRC